MRSLLLLSACAFASAQMPAEAASLRAFRALHGPSVRLSDLFDAIESPDRVLGAAPAPGDRITVQAPQLAAIARDYGVDWRPMTGAEQAVLQRESSAFPQETLMALLRPRLAGAGAPADAAIEMPDYAPPLLPKDAVPQASLADFVYDAASYRFSGTLTVTVADMVPVTVRLVGQVVPMVDAAVLSTRLHGGSVLSTDDVRAARLPVSALHGEAALSVNAVLGLALRRDFPAGQALAIGDLTHPVLVARNAQVRMVLSAGTIVLAAEGVALEEGAMGAHIRVQNPSSHAVMVGEVSGADEVRIMPGRAPVVVAAQ
jgi:flagella basal body P-ring formation protein FlgA